MLRLLLKHAFGDNAALSMRELADTLHMTPEQTRGMFDALEQLGYLARVTPDKDAGNCRSCVQKDACAPLACRSMWTLTTKGMRLLSK